MSYQVLFVCLGNICRSPVANGVFKQLIEARGLSEKLSSDSCGTGGWHAGESGHERSTAVALEHGVDIRNHVARQLQDSDYTDFDLLVAMDRSNLRDMKARAGNAKTEMILLRNFDDEDTDPDVPDPYYNPNGFYEVQGIITRCCTRLIEHLEENKL